VSASLLPPLSRSNNHGPSDLGASFVERRVPTEFGVGALHREVSGFQRDDAECFAFFVAQFSRFGTRPVALIREARNFVSKWPVRSLPLLQLNTGTMKFTSYEAQAIEPLVSNESLPGLDLSDTERAGFFRILSVFSRLQSES
jgi:hypothetical protein